jgi:DNA-binding CsgD family transcriptional regulator
MAGPEPGQAMLTPREREIVSLVAQGHTGEAIGVQLFLSHHTVRTHIRNAMEHADARTRPHLIALALEAGEITFDPLALSQQ